MRAVRRTMASLSITLCLIGNNGVTANGEHDNQDGHACMDGLPPGAVARYRVVENNGGPNVLTHGKIIDNVRAEPIHDLVLTRDGKIVIGHFGAVPIVAWETATAKEQGVIFVVEACRIALARDGKTLAVGLVSGKVLLFDPWTRKKTGELNRGMERRTEHLAFSSDGKSLIDVSTNETARWPLEPVNSKPQTVLTPAAGLACSSVKGDYLAVCDLLGRTVVYEIGRSLVKGRELEVLPRTVTAQNAVNGDLLSTSPPDQYSRLPGTIAISADGRRLAVGIRNAQATIRVLDVATGREVYSKALGGDRRPVGESKRQGVARLAISPDDKYLLAAGYDGRLNVWRLETGEPIGVFDGLVPSAVEPLASYTPDGKFILSGDGEGHVIIWDATQRVVDGRLKPRGLSDADIAKAWEDLLVKQSTLSTYSTAWSLVSETGRTVAFLRERLSALPEDDPKTIAALVAELGDDRYAVREKAMAELRNRGQLAESELRRLLGGKPNAEAKQRAEQILKDQVALQRS